MAMRVLKSNTLYYYDCLDLLREVGPVFKLAYLDPPWKKDQSFNMIFGRNRVQAKAYEDTWFWGEAAEQGYATIAKDISHPARGVIIGLKSFLGECGLMAYLVYMAIRLQMIKTVLTEDACIYLHCDPTVSHYLKLVMDAVFGAENFRNEIVWSYRRWPAKQENFQRMHDVILRYSMSDSVIWNQQFEPLAESTLKTFGTQKQVADFSSGRRKPGKLEVDTPGAPMRDVWDIGIIAPISKERTGWPTQKPIALLRRVIVSSTNPGDLVLDGCCGCGATVVAAELEGRRWVGCDISPFALDLVNVQLKKLTTAPAANIVGFPTDLDLAKKLAASNPLHFEKWAASRIVGVVPNKEQVGDGGIDGKGVVYTTENLVVVQVKSGVPGIKDLREFRTAMNNAKAEYGVFITMEKSKTASHRSECRKEGTVKMGAENYPRMQMWSIEEHFAGVKPDLPTLAEPKTKGRLSVNNRNHPDFWT